MEEYLVLCKVLDIRQLEYFTEILLRRTDNGKVMRVHTGKRKEYILKAMQRVLDGQQNNASIYRCAIGTNVENDNRIKFCYDISQSDIDKFSRSIDIKQDIVKFDAIAKEWLSMGIGSLSNEKWNSVKNIDSIKPSGGLWASKYRPNHIYKSKWHEWCAYYMPQKIKNYGVVFKLKDTTRVFIIDCKKDLKFLYGKYKLDSGVRHLNFLDFEKISKDYDCIYLTSRGYEETKTGDVNLYMWDCASLLVLNINCIGESRDINIVNKI